jgi:hypothetical protein
MVCDDFIAADETLTQLIEKYEFLENAPAEGVCFGIFRKIFILI